MADIARRHHMRYVHVSADCVFERDKAQHDEDARLDLRHPRGQALAAGEVVAPTVPRYLIVRTGWVIGREGGVLADAVTAARKGAPVEVPSGHVGRLTYASRLAAGIVHLLKVGAPAGVYNLTGDGQVVTGVEVVRRVFTILGADPGRVVEVEAEPGEATGAVLSLERIKATGFRPGNSWLDLIDHLPEPSSASAAGAVSAPSAGAGSVSASASVEVIGERGPYRLLFVCTGNICRSAFAEVVARGRGVAGVEFSSAGVRAVVGEGMDPPMAGLVGRRGDASGHRARQLTREMMEEANLVIAMAADHRRFILDEWPALGRKAFVIGQVAREIGRLPEDIGLDGLVGHLWRHRSTEAGDEVVDPYGRGAVAAARAAEAIDRDVDAIVGGLGRLLGRSGP